MEKKTYIYIFGESACYYCDNNPKRIEGKSADSIRKILSKANADGAVLEYEFTDREREIYEQGIQDCDGWSDHMSFVKK